MAAEAKEYFDTYSGKQCNIVKGLIRNLRKREHEADRVENELKSKVLSMAKDRVAVFHIVRLAKIIGSVADYAENAGDMTRAMVARKKKSLFRKYRLCV